MGTIINNCSDFYNKCFEAFTGKDFQVILSVGNKIEISSLQHIPDNFVVRNYIPQLEVLKQVDVFISHGGLNSVSEALYYHVPVIAIPMVNDQPAVSKRINELGAGLALKMEEVTPDILLRTVHTILSNPIYKNNCINIGNSFIEAGGYKKAANDVINFINNI